MRVPIRTILRDYQDAHPVIESLSLRVIPAQAGIEVAHMPVDSTLAHLWVNHRNNVYRPHLVRAVAALQRHEPTLLLGWHGGRTDAAWFCVLQQSLTNPDGRTLIVVEDDAAGLAAYRALSAYVADIPLARAPQVTLVHGDSYDRDAHIVIAPFHALQREVLRRHDTVWQAFWQRFRQLVLIDVHRLSGIAWQHARWMVRRIERLRTYHAAAKPMILLTATPAHNAAVGAASLLNAEVTIVPVDDIATQETLAVDIQVSGYPYQSSVAIARQLQHAGYRVHILIDDVCAPVLWDEQRDGATLDDRLAPADVIIIAGQPASSWDIDEALAGGYHAVLHLQGQSAAEALHKHYGRAAMPFWVCGSDNPYVHTMHILAAAAEVPVLQREAAQWALTALCARMEAQGYLRLLPGKSFVPAGAEDPHAEFSLHDAIGLPALVQYAGESLTTTADATVYERWLAPRMAVPAWRGGMAVSDRDIATGSVTITVDAQLRLTLPIRATTVRVVEATPTDGQTMGWARVAVDDILRGMREWVNAEWHDVAYSDTVACTWYAPAIWWEVAAVAPDDIPWLGWLFIAALQAQIPMAMHSIVPCYDEAQGRLYMVETQPGGIGLFHTGAALLPVVLETAQRAAQAPAGPTVLEPLWRVDAPWLANALYQEPLVPEPFSASGEAAGLLTPADADVVAVRQLPPDQDGESALLPDSVSVGQDESVHAAPPEATHDAFMATLLDEGVRVRTERMPTATDMPLWQSVVRWLTAQRDRLLRIPPADVFLLGDEVICVPYGAGVIIGVETTDAAECYRVATKQYGEVVIDLRRDLMVRKDDKSASLH
ncbi:MAG: hypothetical protein RLY87_1877 [Chloroflexota bacterium]